MIYIVYERSEEHPPTGGPIDLRVAMGVKGIPSLSERATFDDEDCAKRYAEALSKTTGADVVVCKFRIDERTTYSKRKS